MRIDRIGTLLVGLSLMACSGVATDPPAALHPTTVPTVASAAPEPPRQAMGPIMMTVRGWQMPKDRASRGPLAIGDLLRSGDYFHYEIRVDRDAYVYVLQFFADGASKMLFPEQGDVRLAAHHDTRVPPDPGLWFQLDDTIGTEHMYLIASVEPLSRSAPALAELVGAVRSSPSGESASPPPTTANNLVESDNAASPPPGAKHTTPPGHNATTQRNFSVLDDFQRRSHRTVNHRAVNLVRVDDDNSVSFQGRTDQRGVGVAHFPFRHE